MSVALLLLACTLAAPVSDSPPAPVPVSGPVTTVFPPPPGAKQVEGDGFSTWIRALRVLPADTPVTTHDGRVVRRDARVIDLPLVRGDLQQCADTALRLRGEWLRSQGRAVTFHATSGDPLPWARYAAGERAVERNGRLQWTKAAPASWEAYLRALFMWAGTASLVAHDTVPAEVPRPGDLVVEPGFPGHAVILLDVATDGDDTYVLVGQGLMPAQSMHVEHGPHGGWWRWDERLELSSWELPTENLRRWRG